MTDQLYAGDIIRTNNRRVWWMEDYVASHLKGHLIIPNDTKASVGITSLFTVSLEEAYFAKLGWCDDLGTAMMAAALGGEEGLCQLQDN